MHFLLPESVRMWFKLGMPRMKSSHEWALGFPAHFKSVVNPQAVGGMARQLGVRPRGKPKVTLHELMMVAVAHALAPSGDLAMHAEQILGKKISGSALSQRRQGLPWQLFEWMMERVLGPRAELGKHAEAFWRGYRLVGVDGTMFSARNTAGILGRLVKAASRRMGAAFAKLRVVMLVELGTHHPMAAVIGTGQEGELTLAARLIGKVPEGCLLVADRLFGAGAFLVRFLQQWASTRRDFLVRVSSTPKVEVLQVHGDGSARVQIGARSEGQKFDLLVREIRGVIRRRDGKRAEIRLWTSLLDAQDYPATELLRLYARRWEQEIAFKELKVQLQQGPLLDSQTVETAMQEMASLIVAQALVARVRMQAADSLDGQVLRISFAQVHQHVQMFWWISRYLGDTIPEKNIRAAAEAMLDTLATHATPPRRARSCPRAIRQPVSGWPRLIHN
ncbi:MAG: IS4 family transposase, partial [Terrimicrobiaceae bacterium]